jgi:hypothetical protein
MEKKSELYFHLNDPQLQQDFYLQNQDAIKIFLRFSTSVRCVDSHIILPDCIFMYLQFKSQNHYNIREQFRSIPFHPLPSLEIALDNRSSVHEFLMHFSRFSSLPHTFTFAAVEMHWKFSIHLVFFHFTVE